MSGKRVLITGISGFTGRYLASEMEAAGYTVFGTVSPGTGVGSSVFAVDLCDRAGLCQVVDSVRPDLVAHLAAISFVAHGDVEAIYRTNLVGTRNLLDAFSNCSKKPRAVLLASSANIYGNASVPLIGEGVQPAPANDYAVSKLAMEYMARLWLDRLPVTIVRPFNYTGVGQSLDFLVPKIIDHYCRGALETELGNLDVARDFSDVRTVVAVYRLLMEKAPAGEIFNVCSGRAYALSEILEMLAEISGHTLSIRVNPAFVRSNEVKVLRGDNTKLRAVVGEVKDYSLRDTLEWMYKSCLAKQENSPATLCG